MTVTTLAQDEVLIFKSKAKEVIRYQVVSIEANKATLENLATGETKDIKRYQGKWKIKGGILIRP